MWWESREVTPKIEMAWLSHDLNNKCQCWLDPHNESVSEKAIMQICWVEIAERRELEERILCSVWKVQGQLHQPQEN